MSVYTIKDLENLSGIKAHTIRIWEQRYNFLKPKRTGTNIRYYSNEELKTILNIALLNRYGYKISHINKMREQEIREKILSLDHQEAQQERIVNDLLRQMVDLEMEEFETGIDSYILSRGIEKTVIQIIFPFLEKIGILWQTGHINPAQEHLVSNIIRQKLIVAINETNPALDLNISVCLFLPEGEFHELGLLFMYFLMKSRGIHIIYLGASVAMEDLLYVVKQKAPDFIYTHLTAMPHNFNFEFFTNNLTRKMAGTPVIISGHLAQTYEKRLPSKITLKKSPNEVIEFITK